MPRIHTHITSHKYFNVCGKRFKRKDFFQKHVEECKGSNSFFPEYPEVSSLPTFVPTTSRINVDFEDIDISSDTEKVRDNDGGMLWLLK